MRQKLRLNGIVGVIMIIGMFVLAYTLQWNILWAYFVAAIVLYTLAIFVLTTIQESNDGELFRWFLGCHLALMFLAVGLLIHFQDYHLFQVHHENETITKSVDAISTATLVIGYFTASILGGLAIPFLVLKRMNGKHTSNLNGILAILLIIFMFGIAVAYRWDIPWLYFIVAIALYGSVNVVEIIGYDAIDDTLDDVRLRIGIHLAFIFLLVGFWLHSNNTAVYTSFFIGGIAGGLIIPYLVLRGHPEHKDKDTSPEPGE